MDKIDNHYLVRRAGIIPKANIMDLIYDLNFISLMKGRTYSLWPLHSACRHRNSPRRSLRRRPPSRSSPLKSTSSAGPSGPGARYWRVRPRGAGRNSSQPRLRPRAASGNEVYCEGARAFKLRKAFQKRRLDASSSRAGPREGSRRPWVLLFQVNHTPSSASEKDRRANG